MQGVKRAIKRGKAVIYNNGRGLDIMRKKGVSKEAWHFAVKNKVDIEL